MLSNDLMSVRGSGRLEPVTLRSSDTTSNDRPGARRACSGSGQHVDSEAPEQPEQQQAMNRLHAAHQAHQAR